MKLIKVEQGKLQACSFLSEDENPRFLQVVPKEYHPLILRASYRNEKKRNAHLTW